MEKMVYLKDAFRQIYSKKPIMYGGGNALVEEVTSILNEGEASSLKKIFSTEEVNFIRSNAKIENDSVYVTHRFIEELEQNHSIYLEHIRKRIEETLKSEGLLIPLNQLYSEPFEAIAILSKIKHIYCILYNPVEVQALTEIEWRALHNNKNFPLSNSYTNNHSTGWGSSVYKVIGGISDMNEEGGFIRQIGFKDVDDYQVFNLSPIAFYLSANLESYLNGLDEEDYSYMLTLPYFVKYGELFIREDEAKTLGTIQQDTHFPKGKTRNEERLDALKKYIDQGIISLEEGSLYSLQTKTEVWDLCSEQDRRLFSSGRDDFFNSSKNPPIKEIIQFRGGRPKR